MTMALASAGTAANAQVSADALHGAFARVSLAALPVLLEAILAATTKSRTHRAPTVAIMTPSALANVPAAIGAIAREHRDAILSCT